MTRPGAPSILNNSRHTCHAELLFCSLTLKDKEERGSGPLEGKALRWAVCWAGPLPAAEQPQVRAPDRPLQDRGQATRARPHRGTGKSRSVRRGPRLRRQTERVLRPAQWLPPDGGQREAHILPVGRTLWAPSPCRAQCPLPVTSSASPCPRALPGPQKALGDLGIPASGGQE